MTPPQRKVGGRRQRKKRQNPPAFPSAPLGTVPIGKRHTIRTNGPLLSWLCAIGWRILGDIHKTGDRRQPVP